MQGLTKSSGAAGFSEGLTYLFIRHGTFPLLVREAFLGWLGMHPASLGMS